MLPKQSSCFESIQKELEEVRLNFFRLLDAISDSDWDRRLLGEGWTVKQEMVHIVQVLNVLSNGIRRASSKGKRSMLAIVPPGLRSWVNGYIVIPFLARSATRQSIAKAYDKAHNALLGLLKELPEEAWSKGVPYPRKYRTVEQMAHRPAEHFKEHVAHLRTLPGIKLEGIYCEEIIPSRASDEWTLGVKPKNE